MKAKKLKKIQTRATKIFTEILGDSVETQFRLNDLAVDVRYCARMGCEGCAHHVFSIGGLDDGRMEKHLPPLIYECVARRALVDVSHWLYVEGQN